MWVGMIICARGYAMQYDNGYGFVGWIVVITCIDSEQDPSSRDIDCRTSRAHFSRTDLARLYFH
jgi:hypothetical protein